MVDLASVAEELEGDADLSNEVGPIIVLRGQTGIYRVRGGHIGMGQDS